MKLLYLLALALARLKGADSSGWCASNFQSLDYPVLALQAQIGGVVRIGANITPNGAVRDTRIVSGNRILGQAAIENVRKWRFMRCSSDSVKPTPREKEIEIVYDFELVGVTTATAKTLFSYEHPIA
jgi:TonB family protein